VPSSSPDDHAPAPDGRAHDPRERAVEIVRTLRDRGKVAYLAGGCVRDELLGLAPTDYDVATDATPDEIASIFPRTSLVGAAFGVVLVHQGKARTGKGRTTEVATFRTDIGYGDKRRPDRVEFTDEIHDAQRRDFTINALFLDPLETGDDAGVRGRVIDYVGGRADLAARVVRAVGDPSRRLDEDHLRALRAVRFACRLGFAIDPATADAIRAHASELQGVSNERVGEEMRRMLAHPSRALAVRMVDELGLDTPTLGRATTDPGGHALLDSLPPEAGFPLALATLAIERHGRDPLATGASAAIARWRGDLCLSNDERDASARILETLTILRTAWFDDPVARQKRVVMARSFADARTLLGVLDPERAARLDDRLDEIAGIGMGLAPAPLLDGEALIGMGLTPGPAFARILEGVYDGQLDGRVADRAGAAALARELAASLGV
jgi:poly(A) polymerase